MLSEKDKEFIIDRVVDVVESKILKKIGENKPSKFVLYARTWFNWLTPPTVIVAIWTASTFVSDSRALQFETPQQKANTIEHIKNAPDPVVLDLVRRHATDPGIHMPKTQKDSIYVTRQEHISLIKSNAIDRYNIKRSQDKMIETLDDMTKTLKAMSYKLDVIEHKKN